MFYVFLAEGFEETEALATLDVMRRAKLDVLTVGVTGDMVTSSHKVTVKADITPDKVDFDNIEGMNNEEIDDLLYEQLIWEENVKQVQILSIEDQEVEYNEEKHL